MSELNQFQKRLRAAAPALASLLAQLQPGLLASRWSTLIGDDVSGRGPAYILQSYTHELAVTRDVTEPMLIFFAGGVDKPTPEQVAQYFPERQNSHIDEAEEQRLIDKKRNELLGAFFANQRLGQRVLIVADTMDSGQTVLDAAQLLDRLGVTADIAAVGATDTADYYIKEAAKRGLNLVWYIGREHADNSEVLSAPKKSNHLYGIRKEGILPQTVPLEAANHKLTDAVQRELQAYSRSLARIMAEKVRV